jgi:hypothetical protein
LLQVRHFLFFCIQHNFTIIYGSLHPDHESVVSLLYCGFYSKLNIQLLTNLNPNYEAKICFCLRELKKIMKTGNLSIGISTVGFYVAIIIFI